MQTLKKPEKSLNATESNHISAVYLERVVRDRSKTVTSVAVKKTLGSASDNLMQEQEFMFKIECFSRNKSSCNSKIAASRRLNDLKT